jgi:hypothetical protein
MIDVCWAVDVEMSPMSASAPVLKIPMASPDKPIRAAKNRKASPTANRKHAQAKSISPATIVRRRLKRSANWPKNSPAAAIPAMVAY